LWCAREFGFRVGCSVTGGRCYDQNFLRFSAKIWRFYQKTMLRSNFLHNLALFWVENVNFFADFFGKNIF
jgi:hypothetical protein